MILARVAKIVILAVIILTLVLVVNRGISFLSLFGINDETGSSLGNLEWGEVGRGSIEKRIKARGKVALDATYSLIPKVKGRISAIMVNVGEPVKKGQTLAILEVDPAFLDQVEEAIFNIKRLTIQISEDKDRIQNEKALLKEKFSSENRLKLLTRDLLLKENELSFWKSKLHRFALQVDHPYDPDEVPTAKAYLKSPVSGIVLSSNCRPGHHTQTLLEDGLPLFVVGVPSQMYVLARFSQLDLTSIHKGDKVIMHFDGIPDVDYKGRITRIALQSQPSPQLTIPYFDVFVQFDEFEDTLKLGMTCDLYVIAEHKDNVLLVDSSAIYFKDTPGVFVRTPEGFYFRPVQLGIESGKKIEILSGLHEGETVVLNALEAARNLDEQDAR